jgi:pyridoxamine 5'-phosphate oxidase-like protein
MTDSPNEPLDEGAPSDQPPEAAPAPAEQASRTEGDRRSFLRQLSGDAVWTAGRLAGASAVIRRSLVAAGDTAIRSLEEAADPSRPQAEPAGPASGARATVGPVAPVVPAAEIASPPVSPTASAALTPAQHAFLEAGATATLAVNDPAGAPFLTTSKYLWDGETIRLPAQDVTARVSHVDRDPRVSVLIEDPATDAWVAVTGVASLVYGDQVEAMTLAILRKYLSPDAAADQWDALRSTGDRLVIEVSPTRFVWRHG